MKDLINKLLNKFGYSIVNSKQILNVSSEYIIKNIFNRNSKLIIFDIGAHVGQSARKFSRLFSNSKIYSFEPAPKEYEILIQQNIKNFEAFNFGFSNQKSYEKFLVNSKSATSSLLPLSENSRKVWGIETLSNKETIYCNFDTVDSFCSENNIKIIDFMKIDVQGSEYLVLDGARDLLSSKNIKVIQLEVILGDTYKGQKTIGYYINLLESYEYKLKTFSDFVIKKGSLIQTDLIFTSIWLLFFGTNNYLS